MIECKFCKKIFKDRRLFSWHLTKIEIDKFESDLDREKYVVETFFGKEVINNLVNEYKAERICIYELTKKGCDISKYLSLLGIKRTSKEERQTERYKSTYLKGIQNIYGNEITSISQVKEIKEKKKNTAISKCGSYEKYLNDQRIKMQKGYEEYKMDNERTLATFEKTKATCLDKYGHSNFGSSEVAKEKSIKKRRETIATWDYEERLARTDIARAAVCSRGGYESSIEKRVQHCLVNMDINFIKHFHRWHYNYDLLINDKVIIEIQGDMWHAFPGKYKATDLIMGKLLAADIWKKDEKKKKIAEENGYKIAYIWEHEIRKTSDSELANLILSRIEEK